MDNEVYTFALKNALNEIRNACPDITNTFMFREDGEIIAGDENTPEKTMAHVVNAFDGIFEKADAIGGVECITIEGSNGKVNVSWLNDLYFVTVTSRKADMNNVNTVTRVLVPTVLRLLEKICPTPLKSSSPLTKTKYEPKIPTVEEFEKPEPEVEPAEETEMEEPVEETKMEEPEETVEAETEHEQLLPEPPVNQFIVESLSGLLVASDSVRIDSETLLQWEELYKDRKIEEVEIATFDGKTMRCKVKTIKDSKYELKGIMQIPEKIQHALEIRKGELVRAKPIVE
jgi:predicted regulator of Ras-like GTPase activity (Roadblock/LC7/MglB family)